MRALFRNGGGVFGNCGFCVRHSGESFLRLVGARRFITPVATKCKVKLGISAKNLKEANSLTMVVRRADSVGTASISFAFTLFGLIFHRGKTLLGFRIDRMGSG